MTVPVRRDGAGPELVFTHDQEAAVRNGTADFALLCLALGWLPQASRPGIVSFARSLQRIAADRAGAPRLRTVAP
jgi:type IV secretory pathway TrbD component